MERREAGSKDIRSNCARKHVQGHQYNPRVAAVILGRTPIDTPLQYMDGIIVLFTIHVMVELSFHTACRIAEIIWTK